MFPFHNGIWRPQRIDEQPVSMRHMYDADADMDFDVAAVMPLPMAPQRYGSSQDLTARFAKALTLKDVRLEKIGRHKGDRSSKNCVNERKRAQRRLKQAHARENAQLHASITALRQNIAALEASRTLADSHAVLWRTNRTAVVVDMCREYFLQFADGYDSTTPDRAWRRDAIQNFMYSIAMEDLVCREYRGIDKLLGQWEIYTKFHSDTICRLRQIALVDEEDEVVSIRCMAELDLGISEKTLKHLYPDFYAQSQENENARRIAEGLIGKRYVVSFDKVLHFNRHGKMVAHESKVHLASGLMAVLQDPIAAMEVLQGSVMTVDGHWNTSDVDYMRVEEEEMYEMPKLML